MTEIAQKLQQVVFRKASRTVSNQYSRNIFKKLTDCHTGNIGVHHYRCESSDCGHERYQFHSCGNRHLYVTIREKYGVDIRVCPKCKEHHLELVATHNRTAAVFVKEKPKNKASPTEF